MSILHQPSLLFNTKTPKTAIKPQNSFTSSLCSSSSSLFNLRYPKLSSFSMRSSSSSANGNQDGTVFDSKSTSFVNESEQEPQNPTKLSDSDPPINEDEQVGADEGQVKVEVIFDYKFVDEWGEISAPELQSATTKLSESDPPRDEDEWGGAELVGNSNTSGIEDEWGEKSEMEPQPGPTISDLDPPIDDDEWGSADEVVYNNKLTLLLDEWGEKSVPEPKPPTTAGVNTDVGEDDGLLELKKSLMDMVYGTNFGFRASSEVRAEALELVCQLEAANPTPAPIESPELLDGNWILVFTAFSELLPLLAVGTVPLLKVEKISQVISTSSLTIENSATLSSPIATSSFSAIAAFEVRSPSRIQVEFKEGSFKLPEIKSNIDLPKNVDIFGQNISLSPLQQSLGPLENALAGIAQIFSGLSPLKIPIPGERTKSWLVTTYLDKDLRISRGDGGLFVLVKEESPLLDR